MLKLKEMDQINEMTDRIFTVFRAFLWLFNPLGPETGPSIGFYAVGLLVALLSYYNAGWIVLFKALIIYLIIVFVVLFLLATLFRRLEKNKSPAIFG